MLSESITHLGFSYRHGTGLTADPKQGDELVWDLSIMSVWELEEFSKKRKMWLLHDVGCILRIQ